jgi:hypothetical protein
MQIRNLVQPAIVKLNGAPGGIRPHLLPNLVFGCEQLPVAGVVRTKQRCGGPILHNMSVFDDQYSLELTALRYVMCNAKQRGVLPHLSSAPQQLAPRSAVQSAERFIKNDQPGLRPKHGATQSHALTLPAGDQSAAFAEPGLQAITKRSHHGSKLSRVDGCCDRNPRLLGIKSIVEVLKK